MPKISIICPVLNVAGYIEEMVSSIMNQTLKDIEIIIVDAGSTDGTREILQRYSEKDTRIRLLESPRKSMGYQYNMGLDTAKGEWIGFVEGDDYITPEMFEKLYKTAQTTDADIVKSDFNMFFDTEEHERVFMTYRLLPGSKKDLYDKNIVPREYEEMIFRDVNIWNGIYKKKFLDKNKIRFNETLSAAFQDTGFNLQALVLADSVIYKPDSFYCYRRDNESSSVYNNKAVKYVIDEFYFIKDFLERNQEKAAYFRGAVSQRMFGLFTGFYSKANPDFWEGRENREMIECFAQTFLNFYYSIGEQELSQYDFRQSLGLHILSESLDRFKEYIYARSRTDKKALIRYIDYLKKQKQIVIFGCGERGSSTCAFLRRNNIRGISAFCDNNQKLWGQVFVGVGVLSPESAVKQFPDACYLVANDSAFFDIRRQLEKMNIRRKQIYKAMSIAPHASMEFFHIS